MVLASMYISPLIQSWWYIVGPLAAVIGIGALSRSRIAVIALSVLYALAAANDQPNLIIGDLILLPRVLGSSPADVAITASIGLLPAVLTAVSWKRLR
jgi:hypothetical protein